MGPRELHPSLVLVVLTMLAAMVVSAMGCASVRRAPRAYSDLGGTDVAFRRGRPFLRDLRRKYGVRDPEGLLAWYLERADVSGIADVASGLLWIATTGRGGRAREAADAYVELVELARAGFPGIRHPMVLSEDGWIPFEERSTDSAHITRMLEGFAWDQRNFTRSPMLQEILDRLEISASDGSGVVP